MIIGVKGNVIWQNRGVIIVIVCNFTLKHGQHCRFRALFLILNYFILLQITTAMKNALFSPHLCRYSSKSQARPARWKSACSTCRALSSNNGGWKEAPLMLFPSAGRAFHPAFTWWKSALTRVRFSDKKFSLLLNAPDALFKKVGVSLLIFKLYCYAGSKNSAFPGSFFFHLLFHKRAKWV